MLVISVAYGIFALSLLFQGHRWGATPAYHNLLAIMPAAAWGGVFATTSTLLGLSAWKHHKRWLAIAALTVALAVTTGWGGDFIVRWLTSANTTPETWVSWGVFDYMLLRAAARLDIEEVTLPKRRGEAP
jgi:hypothetical protein